MVAYLPHNLKIEGSRPACAQIFFHYTAGNSGGAENSTEKSGPHAKNFFCSMYEMSQRHPVWVAENHVNPCNSVLYEVKLYVVACNVGFTVIPKTTEDILYAIPCTFLIILDNKIVRMAYTVYLLNIHIHNHT
jgi:hypothetical protein